MAQLIVRNLDETTKARLRQRAERNGRSMEEEVRLILDRAAREPRSKRGLGSDIAAVFAGDGLSESLPELRGRLADPAHFRK